MLSERPKLVPQYHEVRIVTIWIEIEEVACHRVYNFLFLRRSASETVSTDGSNEIYILGEHLDRL